MHAWIMLGCYQIKPGVTTRNFAKLLDNLSLGPGPENSSGNIKNNVKARPGIVQFSSVTSQICELYSFLDATIHLDDFTFFHLYLKKNTF